MSTHDEVAGVGVIVGGGTCFAVSRTLGAARCSRLRSYDHAGRDVGVGSYKT